MPKRIALIFAIFMMLVVQSGTADNPKIIYAVFWSGCEEVCQALKDYIKETEISAELVIRNVERDKSKLPDFVKEAREMKADVVLTWGTSTTLGIVGTLDDVNDNRFLNKIPVVFTLVSDPLRSRIIQSYENTGRENITGTRNRVPESLNINIMRKIKPGFKRLGIIFNPAEKNSVLKVNEIRDLQESLNFELVSLELEINEQGQAESSSITRLVNELGERQVDFIYLGSSVFLEDHMDQFTTTALDLGIPVLSPYETLVRKSNAYLSVAAREYDVGILAGEQIKKILVDGKTAGDLRVVSVDQYAYVINMAAARKLNLFPPVDILQISEIVE